MPRVHPPHPRLATRALQQWNTLGKASKYSAVNRFAEAACSGAQEDACEYNQLGMLHCCTSLLKLKPTQRQ
eukprot:scaffold308727_cov36-Tisochrysis_lutea.AAC.3